MGELPAEYRGKSRDFISRMTKAATPLLHTLTEIAQEAAAEYKSHKVLRDRTVMSVRRNFTSIQDTGALLLPPRFEKKANEAMLTVVFLCGGRLLIEGWGEKVKNPLHAHNSEPTLTIARCTMRLGKRKGRSRCLLVGHIGLHALGRRYQRGYGNDDAQIRKDCWRINHHYEDLIASCENGGEDFMIACPSGQWWGHIGENNVGETDHCTSLVIRTFYDNIEKASRGIPVTAELAPPPYETRTQIMLAE